jgi:hypothetical protein
VAVFIADDVFDSWIQTGGGSQAFGNVRFGRCVVGETQFPVGIDLRPDGLDEFVEERGRRVIGGDQQADLWSALRDAFALFAEEREKPRGETVVMGPEIVRLL